jgi:hypothetical protein
MGISFKKSIKIDPVKVNMSKSGVGTLVGRKDARVGINAKGGDYVSTGINGVYYRETLGSPNGKSSPGGTAYGNIRHKLVDMIVIAFTAVLCSYENYEEMEKLGKLKLDLLKSFLELPNGIPNESAFRRVLGCLKYIRGHWSVENQLHWILDIVFWEDECRI